MAVKVQSIPIDISTVMKESNGKGAFSGCKPTQEGWVAMNEAVKMSGDVQAMGKWAVEEHNSKTGDHLKFEKVLYGWTQDIKLVGTLYLLVIQAKDARTGQTEICGAVVGKTTFVKMLIFFARIVIDKKALMSDV